MKNEPAFSLEQFLQAADIARAMKDAGLPTAFISAVLQMERQNRGIFELMRLWQVAESQQDRDEAIADLQEMLEDLDDRRDQPLEKPYIPFDGLDDVAQRILAHKRKLRDLIDRHGGVSQVAERSGIPQPSLSRMLRSASMPRRTTLYRIANALGIPETEVVGEFTW